MPTKNIHDKPFDQSTLAKLTIFENYAQAWIAIWTMRGFSPIHIFDLFAGPGYDSQHTAGCPIRLLDKLNERIRDIEQKGVTVVLHLNEFEPGKGRQENFALLKAAVSEFLRSYPRLSARVQISIYNEDFRTLFPKLLPLMQQYPALVLLDQNGIKFLSPDYLHEFTAMRQTDFLYFAAASYFRRFAKEEEFMKYVALDAERLSQVPYRLIHREVVQQIRDSLPNETDLRLYPFSLIKGANIYGVIFGATHPLAVDRFLDLAWKLDPRSGDANFDIENEEAKTQRNLFEPNLTKRESFGSTMEQKVLNSEIVTNKEALDFCYSEGHPAAHGLEVLRQLKKKGLVTYEGPSPLITYNQVYRIARIIQYKVV